MDDEKRRLRDEVAELAEAVRELRGQLAQQQHCGCSHVWYHWPLPAAPAAPVYPVYPTWTVSYGENTSGAIGSTTITSTNGPVSYS